MAAVSFLMRFFMGDNPSADDGCDMKLNMLFRNIYFNANIILFGFELQRGTASIDSSFFDMRFFTDINLT